MFRRQRWVTGVVGTVLAASIGLVSPANAAAATSSNALNNIGRALAQALGSPSERAWLKTAMDASPYVEHRVPLKQLLTTASGVAPHRAILDRAKLGGREAATIAALPDLELYLASEAQRLAWHGEAGIDVAVRQTDGSYVVYLADGSSRRVPWNHNPGARITLTLGPSEIDYADLASSIRGGARTGEALLSNSPAIAGPGLPCAPEDCPPPPPPPPPPPSGGITTSHTAIYKLRLNHDHEGFFMGLNEIEIFGNINGFYKDCGRVTNIHFGYEYVYTFPAGTPNTTLAKAIPDSAHTFKIVAYEDDSEGCVPNGSDDYLGSWPTGLSLSQYYLMYSTESPSELDLAVQDVAPFEI